MNLETKLKEIKARCEAATRGPWQARLNEILQIWQVITSKDDHISVYAFRSKEQAEFIAYARTDIPLLVEALERAISWIQLMGNPMDKTISPPKLRKKALTEIESLFGEKS